MFANPVDIGNRAAQHCGVGRIVDFNEDSLTAGEISFVYDKLRRAELRRNVWQFAIRTAALRPVATGTMFIAPTLWASTTTYGFGALVTDALGILWQSLAQDNLNNAPGNSPAWDTYCGPLTVQPYDTTGTTGYFAGELVYETPGDGTYATYLSLQSNNSQDPRAPSQWLSTVQYAKDQIVIFYTAWAVGTTYAAGTAVSYLGTNYVSLAAGNVGNVPTTATAKWAAVSPTLAPAYYDSTVAYAIGTFVTYLGLKYVCIAASTGNLPTNAAFWAAQATGTTYVSLIDFNLNQDPSTASFAAWASGTTYTTGNKVGATAGYIYSSVGAGNLGNNPVTDAGVHWTNTLVLNPWTTVNPFGTANNKWLQLAVALQDLIIAYPLGAGPSSQDATRNLYRLPGNFLRRAPQDPKAGSETYLGAPSGLTYDDWNLSGPYIVTREVFPITLRFVADVTDVTKFDDLFCELLAARIALEVCERLTQSTAKLTNIGAAYKVFGTEARLVNGIETGPTEPPEDSWISCRA